MVELRGQVCHIHTFELIVQALLLLRHQLPRLLNSHLRPGSLGFLVGKRSLAGMRLLQIASLLCHQLLGRLHPHAELTMHAFFLLLEEVAGLISHA